MDAVIEAYKKGIDRTLLRDCLKLTPEERLQRMIRLSEFVEELHRSGERLRDK